MDQQIYIYRIKYQDGQVLVADIMKSLTIYDLEFDEAKMKIVPKMQCRDPRGQWCLDMLKINDMSYMISDFKMNLILLTKNP